MNTKRDKCILDECLNMKNDVIFKELFSRPGNEDLLIDFLSSILNTQIESLQVKKDVSLEVDYFEEKYGVLDICAVLNTGKIIDIEMQVANQKDLFKRLEYYASKLTSNQLLSGEKYSRIKEVIVVAILDFNLLDVEEYISETKLVLKSNRDYEIEGMHKYYIVELPKFRKIYPNLNNTLQQWLTFIDGKNPKGVIEAMQNNKNIKKAEKEFRYLTGEEEVRRRAELRLKYIRDTNSQISDAREDGIAEGKREKQIEVVKAMYKNGISVDMICKVISLTEEKVNEIIKSIK